jgi:hypothetical protein
LEIPLEEWKIKLLLVKGKPWLEQKGWFDNTRNDHFTEFNEEVCKELKNHVILDSESEFLNALRKNSLNIIDPLNREVISAWAVNFDQAGSKGRPDSQRASGRLKKTSGREPYYGLSL